MREKRKIDALVGKNVRVVFDGHPDRIGMLSSEKSDWFAVTCDSGQVDFHLSQVRVIQTNSDSPIHTIVIYEIERGAGQ